MNVFRKSRSALTATLQSGLPLWSARSNDALAVPREALKCDQFLHRNFGDSPCLATLYDIEGRRLVETLDAAGASVFPEFLPPSKAHIFGPEILAAEGRLFYVHKDLNRWPTAPDPVASIVVLIDRDWFRQHLNASLTPSEYHLLALLLGGADLRAAAQAVDAGYDTKRKQLRLVMEKLGVSSQPALLRMTSLAISAFVLDALLRQGPQSPEVALAQEVWGRDVVIHSVTIGTAQQVPVWEFGSRRGHPVVFFHSMLAPVIFSSDMIATLKSLNLRVIMLPRHFFGDHDGPDSPQVRVMQAFADVVGHLCDEPVVCLGDSAGCAWAAYFTRHFPELVSETVFVATPQAIRSDGRTIAGLTRIYNSIARVPPLARKTLTFMLRHSSSDLRTVDETYEELRIADWLKLIANTAVRASIDEVAHLQSNWVRDIFRIETPMRFFHGEEDGLCPVEDAEQMVAALPDVPFTRFAQAGHLVLGQRFEEIMSSIPKAQKSSENVMPQSV